MNSHNRFKIPAGLQHTENRPLPSIDALRVEGALEVFVSRSDSPGLTITAQYQEDIEKVRNTIKSGTLTLRGPDADDVGIGGSVRVGRNVVISGSGNAVGRGNIVQNFFGAVRQFVAGDIVNGVSVNGVSFKGAVHVILAIPELKSAEVLGACEVTLLDVSQDELSLDIQGAGELHAQGTVDRLNCDVSGAADIRLHGLSARRASIDISGAASVEATVTQKIKLRISGAADATIWGEPHDRDTRVSGAGDVEFR